MKPKTRWWPGIAVLILLGTGLVIIVQLAPARLASTGQTIQLPLLQNQPAQPPDAPDVQASIEDAALSTPISPLPTPFDTPTTLAMAENWLAEVPENWQGLVNIPGLPATLPPPPTLPPTPHVTPVPTITPPYLAGIIDQPLAPFWIYYTDANQVWRVGSDGQDRELLIDTQIALGKKLVTNVKDGEGTDAFVPGYSLAIAPDGQTLALVVIDPGDEPRSFEEVRIYLYDLPSRTARFLAIGAFPRWSPDSRQLAFRYHGGLWIADLATGDIHEAIPPHTELSAGVSEFVWSPDSRFIAFVYARFAPLPAIWLQDLSGQQPPTILWESGSTDYVPLGAFTWSSDGRRLYYLSDEGSLDPRYHVNDLWVIDIEAKRRSALTSDMFITGYGFIPGQPWLYLTAFHLYERGPGEFARYAGWLLGLETLELRRISAGPELLIYGVSPDGTHLRPIDENGQLQALSLFDGSITPITATIPASVQVGNFQLGGAK